MVSGDLDITIKLNRDGSPYPAQEDVLVKVAYQALATAPVPAPYLVTHPVTWILKDLDRKTEKRVDFVPPPPHGVPRFDEHPVAPVDPMHPVTYTLRSQTALGFLASGKYSLRIEVASPSASFASDWMPFEVSAMVVQAPRRTASSEGAAGFLHLTWRDDGAGPPAIMLREMFIGKGHELMPRTFAVGAGDGTSAPAASTASAGRDPDVFWVGWMGGGKLNLSRVDFDTAQAFTVPAPGPAAFDLVPSLAYTERPDGSDPRLAGMLLGQDAQGRFLQGFFGPSPQSLAWTQPLRLAAGEILSARLVVYTETRRCVFFVRRDNAKLHVEAVTWDEGHPLPPAVPLWSLPFPAAAGFRDFDAVVAGGAIRWGLVLHQPATGGEPARLHCWAHVFNAAENRQGPGIPKSTAYAVLKGPVQVGVKLDAVGVPWILQRDVHGAWAQAPEWKDPLPVETPRGSSLESLYFRRGELPRVSFLDPEAGFANKPVILPTVETGNDDDA